MKIASRVVAAALVLSLIGYWSHDLYFVVHSVVHLAATGE